MIERIQNMGRVGQNIEAQLWRKRNMKYRVKSKENDNGFIELFEKPIDRFHTELRSFINKKPVRIILQEVIPNSRINKAWTYPFDSSHSVDKRVFDYRQQESWEISDCMKRRNKDSAGLVSYASNDGAWAYFIPPGSYMRTIRAKKGIIDKARTTQGDMVAFTEWVETRPNSFSPKTTIRINGETKVYGPKE